jgi:hypothetical protein
MRSDAGRPDGGRRDAGPCPPGQSEAELAEVPAIAMTADACFSGTVRYPEPGSSPEVFPWAMSTGFPALVPCAGDPEVDAAMRAMTDRVRSALEARGLECADGIAAVEGGTSQQLQSMNDRINDCAPLFEFGNEMRIVLDPSGAVVEVRTSPESPELAACVRSALAGLTFPCLASFEVCPEFAIAE